MRRCEECGGPLRKERVREYRDELIGLPGVVLVDSIDRHECGRCGTGSIAIPNLAGLIAAVAVTRAKMPQKLSGVEVRFVRKTLGWDAKTLAQKLDVTPETISRWENGHQPIGPASERLLRLMVLLELEDQTPGVDFEGKAVAEMRIEAVSRRRRPEIRLHYGPIRIEGKRRKAWEEEEQPEAA